MNKEQEVYKALEKHDIPYTTHQHPAVYTVKEAEQFTSHIEGTHTKNIFLRNKKGDTHYLVILPAQKRLDLKQLAQQLKESKLSFASPERLKEYLGLTPGSVSPLGLIYNKEKNAKVILDKELLEAQKIGFHPNVNTATIVITVEDFKKFLSALGYSFTTIS
tara:strand:+ start:6498 stop:6983 length:486 start_codon:yes stop_codon:yes gene_type:complete